MEKGRVPTCWPAGCFSQFSAGLRVISLLLPAPLFLAACATTPPPAVEVRYQRVEVPVATACVDKTKIPAKPAPISSQLTGDPVHDLDLVTAKAKRLSAWGDELAAMLVGC